MGISPLRNGDNYTAWKSLQLTTASGSAWIAYNLVMTNNDSVRDEDAFSEDGVDLTLIRWMLSLTPAERLQTLQSNMQSLETLRGAADRR